MGWRIGKDGHDVAIEYSCAAIPNVVVGWIDRTAPVYDAAVGRPELGQPAEIVCSRSLPFCRYELRNGLEAGALAKY